MACASSLSWLPLARFSKGIQQVVRFSKGIQQVGVRRLKGNQLMAQVQTRQQSVDPEQRSRLLQLSWNQLERPGAYVEVGSGDLYRIPKEALLKGGSPLIHKERDRKSTRLNSSHANISYAV